MDTEALYAQLVRLSDAYYNFGDSGVTDEDFDALQGQWEMLTGNKFSYLGKSNNNKKRLPVGMPSLDKCKDNHALELFLRRCKGDDFCVSEKVDGVSLLLHSKDGKINLYTRGDGKVGSDVTGLAEFIEIPKLGNDYIIRGELVLPREFHSTLNKGENPRNVVAGLVNSKTPNETRLRQLRFVAYSLIGSNDKPSENFHQLAKMGFCIPSFSIVKRCGITCDALLKIYKSCSKNFEIDGLVISHDSYHNEDMSENPKWTVAWKTTGHRVQTTIQEIVWQVSRHGVLCPKAVFDPVKIGDVTIKQATAFNAKFVQDFNLGPGAKICITRSGDVIPFICEVVQGAESPQMPSQKYKWTSDVHISVDGKVEEQDIRAMAHFLSALGCKGLSEAIAGKFVRAGFSRRDILFATREELIELEGFKAQMVEKTMQALATGLSNCTLLNLMVASSCFPSFGEKKLSSILAEGSSIIANYLCGDEIQVEIDPVLSAAKIRTQADSFKECLNQFREEWANSNLLDLACQKLDVKKKVVGGKSWVFSGFRMPDLKSKIEERGDTVTDSVSEKTSGVIIKDASSDSTKVQKAKKIGVRIFVLDEFLEYYLSGK